MAQHEAGIGGPNLIRELTQPNGLAHIKNAFNKIIAGYSPEYVGKFFVGQDHFKYEFQVSQLLDQGMNVVMESVSAEACAKASQRNKCIAETEQHPIRKGTCTHSMNIEFLSRKIVGLLASEYDGAATITISNDTFSLYISIYDEEIDLKKEHDLIMRGKKENQMYYRLGLARDLMPEKVLLVLDAKGEYKRKLPANTPLEFAYPVGIAATEIVACILPDQSRTGEVKSILLQFPFYIPLYNTNEQLLFSFNEWTAGKKRSQTLNGWLEKLRSLIFKSTR